MQSDREEIRRQEAQGRSQAAGSSSDTCQNSNTSYSTRVPPVRPQQSNSQNGGNGEGTQEKKKATVASSSSL